ncbi:DNA damage-regulated autophagy modulator protein 1 isoform X1 [Narcine bancroftii]|uniref:DNA damage-regulated autophagy modulator protein 1 isoform X1 n=1 Tax=Narcine bancroftii TaxID=1343680 RepID=UPI0038321ABF
MCWQALGICCLPILLVSWSAVAFIVSFVIAVTSGHVVPFIPFISDTGTMVPESCVFGLMINISAFLGTVTIYIRYRILQTLNEANSTSSSRMNIAAFGCGFLACLGMCIVANFQETAVRPVHDIGALLAFVMGTFYLFVQSWISCQSRSLCDNPCEVYIRLVLSLVSFMAITPMIVCYFLSSQSTFNFHPSDKGYGYHVASAICEWIVAFCFNIFFLTYIREFKNVTMCIKIEMLQASQIDSVSQRMIH